jgi:hypothetical protein
MEAAAHGDSALGIPAKVGQEYVKADKRKRQISDHELHRTARAGGEEGRRAMQSLALRGMIRS